MSHDSQANPFSGLTKLEKIMFDSNSVGDENVQALKKIIYTSSNKIVELINREKKDFALMSPYFEFIYLYFEVK